MAIRVFARDAGTGLLSQIQVLHAADAGLPDFETAGAPVLSPDGAYLYVVLGGQLSDTQTIAVFARNGGTGTLTLASSVALFAAGGGNLVGLDHLVMGPDGAQVYATGVDDVLATFVRDAATGALVAPSVQRVHEQSGGTLSADGAYLYTYMETSSPGLAVWRRDPVSGAVAFTHLERDHPGSFEPSSDGRQVYLLTTYGFPSVLA